MTGDPSPSNASPRVRGQLLLADPTLRDGTFFRSVVLVSEHLPLEGAHGLILNHPTGNVVGDFLKDKAYVPLKHLPVHDGGPVGQDQLTFSAFWKTPERGLEWAIRISAEEAIQLSQRSGTLVRAFIGYSGWSPGQLENELKQNTWIVTPPPSGLLGLDHDPKLWNEVMGGISPLHRILAEAPANPILN
ncbi:MAG: YqgE/AlgH family protein [Luteolibacter sp.]